MPLLIVATFLVAPFGIAYITNSEKKYVRFERFYNLSYAREKLSKREVAARMRFDFTMFFYLILLSTLFSSKWKSAGAMLFVVALGMVALCILLLNRAYRQRYRKYKGYRKMTHIMWSANILISMFGFFST